MASPVRRVLIVCTANVCRSPVAERFLQRSLDEAGVDAVVRSAGIHGGRNEVHPYTSEAAGFARIDLNDHVSRPLDAELLGVEGADLVIGMTREHLRGAVGLDAACWPRAFTLRELARRTGELSAPPPGWDDWLAACHADRHPRDLIAPDPLDDMPDPYGGPAAAHILMVQEVGALCEGLADAISTFEAFDT